jgi:hypothetical protein
MYLPSFLDRRLDLRQFLWRGAAIGVAGGLAEILVVGGYSRIAGTSAANVAGGVATAVHINAGSPSTGLLVHMLLAVLLGIALMGAGAVAGFLRAGNAWSLYATMFLTLGAVWAVNFMVVLPWVSPAFVSALPLWLSLLSKLSFGLAAAATLHWMSLVRPPRSPSFRVGRILPISI